jgi:nucleotide-binding universal stress UspA family protein
MNRPDAAADRLRVLVGVDGSPGSEAALRWACREAELRPATITALAAWTDDGLPRRIYHLATRADVDGLTMAARGLVATTISRVLETHPSVSVTPTVRRSEPVEALLEAAASADLVVLGADKGNVLRRLTTGKVSQRVVSLSPVPVVVARELSSPQDAARRAVVVGVDGSPMSLAALRWAAGEAAIRRVPLRVVHAWGGLDPLYADALLSSEHVVQHAARAILDDAVKLELDGAPETDLQPVISSEAPAASLLHESRLAQLLVVGSRGHGGFPALAVGSVSHQCMLHAACPVAVVRNDQMTL